MEKKRIWWAEICGWYGVASLQCAYLLLCAALITPSSFYHGLNLSGAIGMGILGVRTRQYQIVVMELVWGCSAIIGLCKSHGLF